MRRGPVPGEGGPRAGPGVVGVDGGAWTGPHSASLPAGRTRVGVPDHGPKFTQGDPAGPQRVEGSCEPPLLVLGASWGRHGEVGSGPAGLNQDAQDRFWKKWVAPSEPPPRPDTTSPVAASLPCRQSRSTTDQCSH